MTARLRVPRALAIAAATLLPTLIIGGWLVDILIARANQPTLRVAIRGYDPRDLLRGHYVNFQLDLQGATRGNMTCACLTPDPVKPLQPKPEQRDCTPVPARGQCPYFLRIPHGSFQYYMAKDAALDVEKHIAGRTANSPPAASVLIHFQGNGAASFSDLRLESPQ